MFPHLDRASVLIDGCAVRLDRGLVTQLIVTSTYFLVLPGVVNGMLSNTCVETVLSAKLESMQCLSAASIAALKFTSVIRTPPEGCTCTLDRLCTCGCLGFWRCGWILRKSGDFVLKRGLVVADLVRRDVELGNVFLVTQLPRQS